MLLLILGTIVAFNFLVILVKFTWLHRYVDAICDMTIFIFIMWLCKGSTDMINIGFISSAIVSIVLLIKPIRLFKPSKAEKAYWE